MKYADIEEQNLGREAMIQQQAGEQIQVKTVAMNEANLAEEAGIQEQAQGNDTDAAMNIIEQMKQAEQQGQNPMAVLETVPEGLQQVILGIIEQEMAQDQGQGNANDGTMPAEEVQPSQPEMLAQADQANLPQQQI